MKDKVTNINSSLRLVEGSANSEAAKNAAECQAALASVADWATPLETVVVVGIDSNGDILSAYYAPSALEAMGATQIVLDRLKEEYFDY